MSELAKFNIAEIRALRELDAEDIEEIRVFLQERRATKWLFGRLKNIAIWATAIIGAIALFSQTTSGWVRQWLGMR